MEFADVVRARRMVRDFLPDPVDKKLIEDCLELATWSPSAGKSQGWHVVGLHGHATGLFWNAALPPAARGSFAFPGLLRAGFVGVFLADPGAYVQRYAEPDKAHTGLGEGPSAWPVPYWTVDASMAAMTFLHAVQDAGLGALFFAVANETAVRSALAIPDGMQVIGAVAVGHSGAAGRKGRSAGRRRRSGAETITWLGSSPAGS